MSCLKLQIPVDRVDSDNYAVESAVNVGSADKVCGLPWIHGAGSLVIVPEDIIATGFWIDVNVWVDANVWVD